MGRRALENNEGYELRETQNAYNPDEKKRGQVYV
jgi:hypothetical protein